MAKPLAIDLYCGLGGWAEGFLAEGWDVAGFDNERHVYGDQRYPAQLVLQDVLTLHGSQFRNAAVIVASPPCQEYSYMAMPWSRAKQIAGGLREECPFPEPYTGSRTVTDLRTLFDACFRIAQEAGVPLVVENVKGAQPWVGEAKAHFGSFYLWGDVGMVGNAICGPRPQFGEILRAKKRGGKGKTNFHFHENTGLPSPSFHGASHESSVARAAEMVGSKNDGGSWFAVANNTTSGHGQNPDGRKVAIDDGIKSPGMNWSDPSRPAQGFNVVNAQRYREDNGTKQEGSGAEWFDNGLCRKSSKSDSRKAASAQIAKIPFPLSSHIARVFKP